MRRIRFAIASIVILILGASAFFIFHSLRTHPAAVESVSNPAVLEKSVAVLPFDNQNRDPDIDYLSDGITRKHHSQPFAAVSTEGDGAQHGLSIQGQRR